MAVAIFGGLSARQFLDRFHPFNNDLGVSFLYIESDEFAHTPGSDPKWKETYVMGAWDWRVAESLPANGLVQHLQHDASIGRVETITSVVIDGVVTSGRMESDGDDCYGAAGLQVDVVAPLNTVRYRYEGLGRVGPDAEGWIATGPNEVPFGFEIEAVFEHAPHDWREALVKLQLQSAAVLTDHFEQGGRWTGRLWSGDTSVETSGLLYRDHSWGPRAFVLQAGFWTPMIFDEGRHFFSGLSFRDVDGLLVGFLMHTDEKGEVHILPDPLWRLYGYEEGGGYSGMQGWVRRPDAEPELISMVGDVHLARRVTRSYEVENVNGINDLMCAVRWSGKVGLGNSQFSPVTIARSGVVPASKRLIGSDS